MEKLIALYHSYTGQQPASTQRLSAAGSNRQYVRLTAQDGSTKIGVIGTSHEENETFCYLSRHFRSKGLPVPEVYAVADDSMRYLQQDLGNRSLYDALRHGRENGGEYSAEERQLLRRTIAILPRIQVQGAQGLDFDKCYPQASMDRRNVLFDLNYFKYCFLKPKGVDFNEMRLEDDFQQLADDLMALHTGDTFMYRDFQARNIMLDEDDNPWFIDFQGGRRGPLEYDLVSFLWQSSAHYPQDLRDEMIDVYKESLGRVTPLSLRPWLFFRLLQVLGAYGFRGLIEKKKYFISSIPPALDNLRDVLSTGVCRPYPHLQQVLESLIATTSSIPSHQVSEPKALVVRVFSFSYKKGIPEDESGNGGGYVFDCRSTHNPGRYEPYKKLTGLDEPVIRFLEDDGEILTFLDSVYKLADAHVERYIERGFTSLMFSFGCTGGQHRSVYSAQHLAQHIHDKYGIEVRLLHREQGIEQIFKS